MPFMQRLTMSGVALHSGMVTGLPASHGCIRLPHPFAIRLYRLTRLGARVIIAGNPAAPADIEHPRLFAPKPLAVADLGVEPALRAVAGGAARVYAIAGERPVQELEAVETVATEIAADFDAGAVRARVGQATAEREAALRASAVSVLVSRSEGRVFVRQGFAPLFDAPISIKDPEQPLGTHVFMAVDYVDNGARMRWTVVSVPSQDGQTAASASKRDKRATAQDQAPERPAMRLGLGQTASDAAEALDRIELPPDIAEQISHLLTPGASLIVSDHGLNREVRPKGTDFVVLTR
jgi:hypothetical protein